MTWNTTVRADDAATAPVQPQRAKDPDLTIEAVGKRAVFKRSDLLARKDLTSVEIKTDPAYPGQTRNYQAVPAAALFADMLIPSDAVIQFNCLDGFSAPLSKDRLLAHSQAQSIAYVAIEPADAPWPALKPGGLSAGPFYLVWLKPELSQIAPEEWPYQLAAFSVKGTLQSLYPKIVPDPKLAKNDPVQRGFRVFATNCFACHTLNKSGSTDVGPDLNLPMNPTEYLTRAAIKRLVRNPQDLRFFPRSRMSSFSPTVLPDAQLDELLAYLAYMAKHKQP